ncbi:hypothetical protein B0H14DRAFT_3863245 [Mycena olivaceomarginata]|nr:hypothetical protein B0H14DRAFT_3863245 [Mycena olivaceomarginata]
MPKSTKDASYSQQHVQERALERYALTLLADDYRKLNEAVQRARSSEGESNAAVTESAESELEPSPAPGAMTLLNEEGDEQIWGVGWGGQTLVCVWSTSLGRVTTLLPEGTVVTRRKGTGTKTKKGKGKK